ncbi:MAG TPA: flippase-like domain-containing protein [Acidimicrobiales bacterium]|nr:flippase-like domain-containing protein [Acidimicrobiales bacterium]
MRKEVRWSVGLVLAFLFVFYLAIPLLASHREDLTALGHIHPLYLILGTVLEIGALAAYTQLTHAVLPKDGPPRLRLFRINMSTLSLSHVSPGGTAPGAALGYRLLTQSGVSGSDTAFALGTQGIGSAVVLNVLFWLALVGFVLVHGFHAPTSHGGGQSGTILVVVAAAIGVILLGAFGGLFYLLTRGQERAAKVVRRISGRIRFLDPDKTAATVQRLAERFAVLLEDRPLLIRAVTWATINWLLDAASLWVFVAAFSHFISPIDLLVAYGLANILAAIPITPGGLGVVEFVLVSMITGFGPTPGQALSGVLAYRAINFWLPIPIGGMAYGSLEFERGNLYRRLHLFFLDRYQRRRGALGVQDESDDEPASLLRTSPVDDGPADVSGAQDGPADVSGPQDGRADVSGAQDGRADVSGAKASGPVAGPPVSAADASPVHASPHPGPLEAAGQGSDSGEPTRSDQDRANDVGSPDEVESSNEIGSPDGERSSDGEESPMEEPHEVATGASATGASATGASATGASATGASATGSHVHRFRRRSEKIRSEKKDAFGPQTDVSSPGGNTSGNDVPPSAGAVG